MTLADATSRSVERLYPVVRQLPRGLTRRARVEHFQSAGGRALRSAAARAGAAALTFARDEAGAPVPEGGWHWSLTNAEGLVAAIVAPVRVGIDVEPLDRPRRASLKRYLRERDPEGLRRLGDDGRGALELWTAFEAALKLLGRGVSGLPETGLDLSAPESPDGWRHVRVGPLSIPVLTRQAGDHVLTIAVDARRGPLPEVDVSTSLAREVSSR